MTSPTPPGRPSHSFRYTPACRTKECKEYGITLESAGKLVVILTAAALGGCSGTPRTVRAPSADAGADSVVVGDGSICVRRSAGADYRCWEVGLQCPGELLGSGSVRDLTFTGAQFCGRSGGQPVCWEFVGAPESFGETPEGTTAVFAGEDYKCALSGETLRCRKKAENAWLGFPWHVAAASTGEDDGCARGTKGEAFCFLGNPYSRRWVEAFESRTIGAWQTFQVTNDRPFLEVQKGLHFFACGRDSAGIVCWGKTLSLPGEPTARVQGLGRVARFSTGALGGCAILEDRRVACWRSQRPLVARIVPALGNAREVSCSDNVCCVVGQGVGGLCWGTLGSQEALSAFWGMQGVRREGDFTRFIPQ